jgi:hypothetical protein
MKYMGINLIRRQKTSILKAMEHWIKKLKKALENGKAFHIHKLTELIF